MVVMTAAKGGKVNRGGRNPVARGIIYINYKTIADGGSCAECITPAAGVQCPHEREQTPVPVWHHLGQQQPQNQLFRYPW